MQDIPGPCMLDDPHRTVDWSRTIPLLAAGLAAFGFVARWTAHWWGSVVLPWRDRTLLARIAADPDHFDSLLFARIGANHERDRGRIERLFADEIKAAEFAAEKLDHLEQIVSANTSALAAMRTAMERQGQALQELADTRAMMRQLNDTMAALNATMREVDTNLRDVNVRLARVEERTVGWDGRDRRGDRA